MYHRKKHEPIDRKRYLILRWFTQKKIEKSEVQAERHQKRAA